MELGTEYTICSLMASYTGKMCLLHNIEKLCNLSEVFLGENKVNLITRMTSMEIYGDRVESDTFYKDYMIFKSGDCLEFSWRKHDKSNY